MNFLFAGSGEFGLPTLQALLAAAHHPLAIFTQPDRPAGRGRHLLPTPIAQYADQNRLPLIRTSDVNAESLPPADILIVIAFGQKILPPAVHHARFGSINLHASLLPRWRGAAPIHWAILSGDNATGNSIIRLAPQMDAGSILAQAPLPITDTETTGELHDRLAQAGAPLVLKVINDLQSNRAAETPQDESQFTHAPKLRRESSRIDWQKPAAQTARQIRALHPWPGCHVRLLDAAGHPQDQLTLIHARPVPSEGNRWHPGDIELSGAIATSSDAVEILDVQPAGKRPMPLQDYRRGHPWLPGMRLQPL